MREGRERFVRRPGYQDTGKQLSLSRSEGMCTEREVVAEQKVESQEVDRKRVVPPYERIAVVLEETDNATAQQSSGSHKTGEGVEDIQLASTARTLALCRGGPGFVWGGGGRVREGGGGSHLGLMGRMAGTRIAKSGMHGKLTIEWWRVDLNWLLRCWLGVDVRIRRKNNRQRI
jgi:hypothetical protein